MLFQDSELSERHPVRFHVGEEEEGPVDPGKGLLETWASVHLDGYGDPGACRMRGLRAWQTPRSS